MERIDNRVNERHYDDLGPLIQQCADLGTEIIFVQRHNHLALEVQPFPHPTNHMR
ncbi:hypothetical protein D3C84_1285060 [compost metagenome]